MTRLSRLQRRARWRPGSDYNVKEPEAAEFLGMSPRELASLRRRGVGPFHVRIRGKICTPSMI
jgi:hypothetical protein